MHHHSVSRWISPPVAFLIAVVAMWLLARHVDWGLFSFPYRAAIGVGLIILGIAIIAVSSFGLSAPIGF
jgi:hypothetical protein